MNASNPYDGERRPGTVGLPLPGCELRHGPGPLQYQTRLAAAGKQTHALQASDLAMLEDFHSLGRLATAALIDLAQSPQATLSSMPPPESAGPPG